MQLGMFWHMRLHKQCGNTRIEARGQPIDHHLVGVLGQTTRVFVTRSERMPVGDEEEARVLVLQIDPVSQGAVVVTEVQLTGRTHAREHTIGLRKTRQDYNTLFFMEFFAVPSKSSPPALQQPAIIPTRRPANRKPPCCHALAGRPPQGAPPDR